MDDTKSHYELTTHYLVQTTTLLTTGTPELTGRKPTRRLQGFSVGLGARIQGSPITPSY